MLSIRIEKNFNYNWSNKNNDLGELYYRGRGYLFDNKNKFINSKNKSIERSWWKSNLLENFEYLINENIFKSIGYIKIEDQKKMFTNSHKFI